MKKAIVFQGGWDGHEPQLTSKRFAAMLEKNGISARAAAITLPFQTSEEHSFMELQHRNQRDVGFPGHQTPSH